MGSDEAETNGFVGSIDAEPQVTRSHSASTPSARAPSARSNSDVITCHEVCEVPALGGRTPSYLA
jgi:hypothetical protein